MKQTDYERMSGTAQSNWATMRRQARYTQAERTEVSNWQTTHRGYGEPMPERRKGVDIEAFRKCCSIDKGVIVGERDMGESQRI